MNSTTFTSCALVLEPAVKLTDQQVYVVMEKEKLGELVTAFGEISDPRHKRGLRYDLVFLLTCLMMGTLCNCDSTEAIAQWCEANVHVLEEFFETRRFLTPCGSQFRRLLAKLDASHIETVLAKWIKQTRPLDDSEAVALDGKVIRGTHSKGKKALELLSFRTHNTHETLYQVVTP